MQKPRTPSDYVTGSRNKGNILALVDLKMMTQADIPVQRCAMGFPEANSKDFNKGALVAMSHNGYSFVTATHIFSKMEIR